MAATYEPIATATTTSGQSTVSFTSIPSTYTDIVLICDAANNSTLSDLTVRFNNDSSSNYSRTYIYGTGSSAGSDRAANETSLKTLGYFNTNQGTGIMHIMNYANTTTYKTAVSRAGSAAVNTSGYVGLWRSTSAINQIDIGWAGGAFAANGVITIYGIKAA